MERDEKITEVLNGVSWALYIAIRYIEIIQGTDLKKMLEIPPKDEVLGFLKSHKDTADNLVIKITKGEVI